MSCPACGAPLEGPATHCLRCGERLVAEPPRPQDWRLPVAIVGGIATLCVAAILFALSRVSADAQKEAAKEVPAVTQPERARER